ncbi:MAG: hypothetical protein AB8B73_07530 [Ekhidna sp.]
MKEDKSKSQDQIEETPEWLKAIQLNSWEAELLVSALVLYALFQLPDLINAFSLRTFSNGSLFHQFFNILITAINLLKFGYALHILVRGLWVASVGLSYVFPGGIDKKRLKFKGRFDKELDSSKSVDNVLKLEELSSLIYGVSFLLFGTMLGMGMLFFVFVTVTELFVPYMQDHFLAFILFIFFYLILLILLLIDFLSNGLFRKIEWMAVWFYPVAVVFRFITFSFLYRRSLLLLISNFKGWRSTIIPFVICAICSSVYFIGREMRNNSLDDFLSMQQQSTALSSNYENLRKEGDRVFATIQSDIVHDDVLRIFLDDISAFDLSYRSDSAKTSTRWGSLNTDSVSYFLNRWLVVKIDSMLFDDVKWFPTQHQTTSEFGFFAILDINEIPRGNHNLSIELDDTEIEYPAKRNIKGKYHRKYLSNIHFFYDKQ